MGGWGRGGEGGREYRLTLYIYRQQEEEAGGGRMPTYLVN